MAYQNQYNAPAQYSPMLINQVENLANQLSITPNPELLDTLKRTAFTQNANNEQMMALLIVANQYKLNPWTKEIYAFPSKGGGIVPIVGFDGWIRIMNSHPDFDGFETSFNKEEGSCTCTIYRKDRSRPIKITEYMDECRGTSEPWIKMPKRMLRIKAIIQCCRVAFGFGGIYDEDEGKEVVANQKDAINAEYEVVEPSISGEQIAKIYNMLESTKADKHKFVEHFGVRIIEDMTEQQALEGIQMLNIKMSKAKAKAQQQQAEPTTPPQKPQQAQAYEPQGEVVDL